MMYRFIFELNGKTIHDFEADPKSTGPLPVDLGDSLDNVDLDTLQSLSLRVERVA